MNIDEAYTLLGCLPSSKRAGIRVKYLEAVRNLHPDRVPPSARADAEAVFKRFNEAYALVKDAPPIPEPAPKPLPKPKPDRGRIIHRNPRIMVVRLPKE